MPRRLIQIVIAGMLVFTPTAALPAAAPPLKPKAAEQKIPSTFVLGASVEGITEYRLPNGLQVLLFPDPGKPTITVNITYLVGSRHEHYGETGMAHLLEHMLFKGTPRHPDIPRDLSLRGARSNGQTSFDRTNYFETFQASDENLRWALDLESDRMIYSCVGIDQMGAAEQLRTEMTVVRNEYESGENNPGGVLYKRLLAVAFDWHNYGHVPIGARSDIENVDISRLTAFYRTYYQPDNAVLLVSGRIDVAKTLALVQQFFGQIPRPARVLSKTSTLEPTQDGERQVVVRRSGDIQLVLSGYHIPPGSDPDFAAVDVLAQALGDTPTGRLHKALVESKQAVHVFGSPFQLREPSYLIFGAQVRPDASLEACKEALLKVLEEPSALHFTTEEVERAKQQRLKDVELAMNDADRVGMALSDYIAMGDWRLFFLDRDRLKAVTAADVERVAKAYLKPSNRTLGLFIPTSAPDRAEIPAMKDVKAMVQDYKGQTTVVQGEAFDASPEAIDARTLRVTTPSGLKLAMVSKKTRGGSVHFRLVLRMGDEKTLHGKATIAEMTADMLMRGTVSHTRSQIADLMDRLKADFRIHGRAEAVVVSGETIRKNLPDVMELIAEIVRKPAFPAQEFELMKQEALSSLDQERSDPASLGQRALTRHLSAYPEGHPRSVPGLDEEAAAVKSTALEDVKAFHQGFYGASSAELSFVGDLDPQETQALMESLLGDWRSPTPYVRMLRRFKDVEPTHQLLRTPDKANAFFMGGVNLALQDTDADYAALLLGDYMLGGGFLNSRLATRLRQKEGISYSVGSDLQAAARERAGQWNVYAIYAPQNEARLEAAFRDELDKALKDGFTEAEIQAAKKGWLHEQQLSRAEDRELVSQLGVNLDTGRTMVYYADLERSVSDLTADQILAALRKYLVPARLSTVIAGDFSKAVQVQ
jgi:zinc protease